MAQQHYTRQSLDPFTTLSDYHVQRLERAIQDNLTEQACQTERHSTPPSASGRLWAWLRRHGIPYRRRLLRRAA